MRTLVLLVLAAAAAVSPLRSQTAAGGGLAGAVTMGGGNTPLHHAMVLVPKLGRSVEAGEDGSYALSGLPPGAYDVVVHMHNMGDERRRVTIRSGEITILNIAMRLETIRTEMTVTATGQEETSLEAVQSVASVNSLELAGKAASTSLGDLLDDQAGVAKRSFGPGNARPVVRGFDGDRVLILQDGMRTGTLSSQSGDHGEPVDGSSIERVEVVRGPGTLLYGSNAIGGVVNIIDDHARIDAHDHEGVRGHMAAIGGTNNAQAGGSGSFEFGRKGWLVWGGGGGSRSGDYAAPTGRIENSRSRMQHANFGIGRHTEAAAFSFQYNVQDGRYGIPFASALHGHEEEGPDEVSLAFRRQMARLNASLLQLGNIGERFNLNLSYTGWNHRELEGVSTGTRFSNKQFLYRGELQQKRRAAWDGTTGFWGMQRGFQALGEEAIAPPVDQSAFALFTMQQLHYDRVKFQFGGRLETNRYTPTGPLTSRGGASGEPLAPRRAFTGASAGAGANVRLWNGGALAANYAHSYRAPSLEELYNFGPHAGNVTFEIGNPNLRREGSGGLDLSLRHQHGRLRAEYNFFYYRMNSLIYLAPTGHFDDGLPVADYLQANGRYQGHEAKLTLNATANLALLASLDQVTASVTAAHTPLPRIPPLRARFGFDYRRGGFHVRPELALAWRQDLTAPNELPTAGYAVPGLNAGYTLAGQHMLHVFGVNLFNLSDRLYRNHLSFIKQYAPEIGRGVRFSYTMHFY
ncbi:MAG: TonB-dependent receptor [Bryobacterales bacterium]|nr:TonB-dependent receptor [Bryobacterales bacterium]